MEEAEAALEAALQRVHGAMQRVVDLETRPLFRGQVPAPAAQGGTVGQAPARIGDGHGDGGGGGNDAAAEEVCRICVDAVEEAQRALNEMMEAVEALDALADEQAKATAATKAPSRGQHPGGGRTNQPPPEPAGPISLLQLRWVYSCLEILCFWGLHASCPPGVGLSYSGSVREVPRTIMIPTQVMKAGIQALAAVAAAGNAEDAEYASRAASSPWTLAETMLRVLLNERFTPIMLVRYMSDVLGLLVYHATLGKEQAMRAKKTLIELHSRLPTHVLVQALRDLIGSAQEAPAAYRNACGSLLSHILLSDGGLVAVLHVYLGGITEREEDTHAHMRVAMLVASVPRKMTAEQYFVRIAPQVCGVARYQGPGQEVIARVASMIVGRLAQEHPALASDYVFGPLVDSLQQELQPHQANAQPEQPEQAQARSTTDTEADEDETTAASAVVGEAVLDQERLALSLLGLERVLLAAPVPAASVTCAARAGALRCLLPLLVRVRALGSGGSDPVLRQSVERLLRMFLVRDPEAVQALLAFVIGSPPCSAPAAGAVATTQHPHTATSAAGTGAAGELELEAAVISDLKDVQDTMARITAVIDVVESVPEDEDGGRDDGDEGDDDSDDDRHSPRRKKQVDARAERNENDTDGAPEEKQASSHNQGNDSTPSGNSIRGDLFVALLNGFLRAQQPKQQQQHDQAVGTGRTGGPLAGVGRLLQERRNSLLFLSQVVDRFGATVFSTGTHIISTIASVLRTHVEATARGAIATVPAATTAGQAGAQQQQKLQLQRHGDEAEEDGDSVTLVSLVLGLLFTMLEAGTKRRAAEEEKALRDLLPLLASLSRDQNADVAETSATIQVHLLSRDYSLQQQRQRQGQEGPAGEDRQTGLRSGAVPRRKEGWSGVRQLLHTTVAADLASEEPGLRAHGVWQLGRAIKTQPRSLAERVEDAQVRDELLQVLLRVLMDTESYVYLAAVHTVASLCDADPNTLLPCLLRAFRFGATAPRTTDSVVPSPAADGAFSLAHRVKIGEALLFAIRRRGDSLPQHGPRLVAAFVAGVQEYRLQPDDAALASVAESEREVKRAQYLRRKQRQRQQQEQQQDTPKQAEGAEEGGVDRERPGVLEEIDAFEAESMRSAERERAQAREEQHAAAKAEAASRLHYRMTCMSLLAEVVSLLPLSMQAHVTDVTDVALHAVRLEHGKDGVSRAMRRSAAFLLLCLVRGLGQRFFVVAQEHLLPVYRQLKVLVTTTERDAVVRQHANTALAELDALAESQLFLHDDHPLSQPHTIRVLR